MELWDFREESKKQSVDAGYHDRVTEMLEAAMNSLGNEFQEKIFDFELRRRKMAREAEVVAHENNDRTYRREHGEIV